MLRKDRELGDYDYAFSIDKEKAKEDIKIAAEISEEIKTYLKSFQK